MQYHKRDWQEYNRQLINRGRIHFWVKRSVFQEWKAKKEKRQGRPFTYGDELIKAMDYIKFHLSLRGTEFFLSR